MINLSFFVVSIILMFLVFLRRFKSNMIKQVEFNEIIDRFESGASHLQLYKDILPKGLMGSGDQESQQLLMAVDDEYITGARQFEKEGESLDEELKKKDTSGIPDDLSEKSFYYEDPDTGEVSRLMIKKESEISMLK